MQKKITRRTALSTAAKASVAAMGGFGFAPSVFSRHAIPDLENKSGSRVEGQTGSGRTANALQKLPFRISLNTSDLMAYELPVDGQIEKVAAAGFGGIELWMRDVNAYRDIGRP